MGINQQFQAAQRHYEAMTPSDPDDAYGEFIKAFKSDEANIREAADSTDGGQDASHYTDLSIALHDLHHTDPDKIVSTGLLTRLYRLAKARAATIDAELESRAEAAWEKECERQAADAADMRDHYCEMARDVA